MSLRRLWSQHANANKALWPTRGAEFNRRHSSDVSTCGDGEPAEGPQASSGLRSDLLHESLRQPSPTLSAWGRLLAALDVPEPHAEAVALARGPVRHPAQQADQARHRGHRNGRSHSDRPGPGVPGRGYPHRRLDTPRPVRHLSAGPCARTQEPVLATPNPPPHPAIETRPRENWKT